MTSMALDAALASVAFDAVLAVMLLVATIYAATLHRELRRFRASNAEYATALQRTSQALESVQGAVRGVQDEAGAALAALGERIDEAHRVIAALKEERARPAPVPAAAPAPALVAATTAPETPKGKAARAAERLLARAAQKPDPQPEPKPEPRMPEAMPVLPRVAMPVEAAPEAEVEAPVRVTRAHQWPTVRLASRAGTA
jgi:hypothetical protein